jgi:protocatechuate 3,4-dioxygenase beta subunit
MKGIIIVVIIFMASIIGISLYQNQSNHVSTQNSLAENNSPSSQPISCAKEVIPNLTEGPYYKENSPQTKQLYRPNIQGEKVTLSGYVVDTNCKPIANAWIDFWQADGNGEYDNEGYTLRGHQYTDSNGKYVLETVIPGEYPGRTPHIHFKVRANDKAEVITSQLYLPDAETNANDAIFNDRLIMNVQDTSSGKTATYTIVIND